jgi:hypothetical protein
LIDVAGELVLLPARWEWIAPRAMELTEPVRFATDLGGKLMLFRLWTGDTGWLLGLGSLTN